MRQIAYPLSGFFALLLVAGCTEPPPTIFDAGSDADTGDDADADVDVDVEVDGQVWEVEPPAPPAEPAPPAPPERPRLRSWTCPERWVPVVHEEVTDEDGAPFSWCQPPPPPRLRVGDYLTPLDEGEEEGDRPICEPEVDGTFPLLGYATCQPLGLPCPSGRWPKIPPEVTGARLYVLAGAAEGDGSAAAPLGTIGEAVEQARSGDVVVVGAGRYVEDVTIDRDLTLWGRCVTSTIIEGVGKFSLARGTVTVGAEASATIHNLSVTGPSLGLLVTGGATTTMRNVWVSQAGFGVSCDACAAMTLSRVLIDRIASEDEEGGAALSGASVDGEATIVVSETTAEQYTNNGAFFWSEDLDVPLDVSLEDVLLRHPRYVPEKLALGVAAFGGVDVTARRLLVDHTHILGLWAQEGASLTGEDVVIQGIRDPAARPDVSVGAGVVEGGRLTLRRALIDRTLGYGVYSLNDSLTSIINTVEIEDSLVRETHGDDENYVAGHGIGAKTSLSSITFRRTLFERNEFVSLAINDGPDALLEDVWIRETRPRSSSGVGQGLNGGSNLVAMDLTVRRALVEGSHGGTIAIEPWGDLPTTVTLEDITTLDSRPDAVLDIGPGLWFYGCDEVTVTRAEVRGSHKIGVLLVNLTDATFQDLVVTDTAPDTLDDIGIGLEIGASTVSVERARLERNHYLGVLVQGGPGARATAHLTDLVVDDTRSTSLNGGAGVLIADAAEATIERALVDGSHNIGVLASGPDAELRLEDARVHGTLPNEEQVDAVPVGVAALGGATLEVARALVSDNAGVGITGSGEGSTLDLVDIEVSDTRTIRLGTLGVGLHVAEGARATVSRGLFASNAQSGIQIIGALEVSLRDVLVRDTRSTAYDSRLGRGLQVEGGGAIEVSNSQLIGNRDVSVAFFGAETTAALTDVLIGESLERACAELEAGDSNRCDQGRGYGLGVYDGAAVTVDDVEIVEASLGLQLAEGGTLTGDMLRIRDCEVAVNLQGLPREYDWETALTDLDVGEVALDESEMSIPERLAE